MAIENPYYGPQRPKGPGLAGILFAPLHHATPVRVGHAIFEFFHLAKKHGRPVAEVIRGHRGIREVAHDTNEFLGQYRQMSTPEKLVQDPVSGKWHKISLITEWAQWNSESTLWNIRGFHATHDIPELAGWINGVLSGQMPLEVNKPRQQRKANEALSELRRARDIFVTGVVNDATLATAEKYYERVNDLHVGSLVADVNRIALGAGTGLATTAALLALGASGPFAIPAGAIISVFAEKFIHNNRQVSIMSEDGQRIEKYRYAFTPKETGDMATDLAQKVDNLLKLVKLPPNLHTKSVQDRNTTSKRSVQRTWSLGSAIVATMPNYYQLTHRLQAYALFNHFLPPEQKTKR